MECPECGLGSYLLVDGIRMSEEALLAIKFPPKEIKRIQTHKRWCTKSRQLRLDK